MSIHILTVFFVAHALRWVSGIRDDDGQGHESKVYGSQRHGSLVHAAQGHGSKVNGLKLLKANLAANLTAFPDNLKLTCNDVELTEDLTEHLKKGMEEGPFKAQGGGDKEGPWQTVTIKIDGVECGSDKFAFDDIPDGDFFIYSPDNGATIKKACRLDVEGGMPLNFPGPKDAIDCKEDSQYYETDIEAVTEHATHFGWSHPGKDHPHGAFHYKAKDGTCFELDLSVPEEALCTETGEPASTKEEGKKAEEAPKEGQSGAASVHASMLYALLAMISFQRNVRE